ncbi:MAG: hypothetical protein Q9216_004117 [Gyalolechia sp. 2 TL-2023]
MTKQNVTESTGFDTTADREISDPNEDDLDDLDELLDDFSSSKQTASQQDAPPIIPPKHDFPSGHGSSSSESSDFNVQLQQQMAALMGKGEESPEMQNEIQAMLQELSAAVESNPMQDHPAPGESQAVPSAPADESFQEAIIKTMERMQASGDRVNAAPTANQDSDDILARMLKEMQDGDQGGTAGDEEFSKMLMIMMEQLTNKDILYDPMKELNEKFPQWISKNKTAVETEDLNRYGKQQRLVAQIVEKFEERTYSDSNAEDREYIVERMHGMQAAGSPPADLVGDMSGAQEALQDLNSGCPQQ